MDIGSPGEKPGEALERVQVVPTVLQDFRPLTESLEWELSVVHWRQEGLLPFIEDDVPFLINNSGLLSEHVAALLFANCVEAPSDGPIRVLELGAGTGLFARYLLDAFEEVCRQEGTDFYDRLTYYVSDSSARTVEQWTERHQFENHREGIVQLGTCDAMQPERFHSSRGDRTDLHGLRAVVCNYVLDVLPATVMRKGPAGPEELLVRTHLTEDRGLLKQYTRLGLEELQDLARSEKPDSRARLLPLISLLEFETSFRAVRQPAAGAVEALADAEELERVVVNHGAIACLESCLRLLDPDGFILLNDYGPVDTEQVASHAATQRFGPTSALGINFPLLERYFGSRECVVVKPESDDERSIHTRLMLHRRLLGTEAAFQNRFGPSGSDFFEAPVSDARAHVAAGRRNEALDSYRLALSRIPRNWHLLGEIAEFVGLQLQDFSAGRELARAAIERNPWHSAWLWNVLGDIVFLDGDIPAAHEAYLQARRIHPRDARTNLNLAFSYFEFGDYTEALNALATAFATDTQGMYRPRLLEKQQQILGALTGRWIGEQERLARRMQRML